TRWMVSSPLVPDTARVLLPAPPSMVSTPSPIVYLNVSLPAPPARRSFPRRPVIVSAPSRPKIWSKPSDPMNTNDDDALAGSKLMVTVLLVLGFRECDIGGV